MHIDVFLTTQWQHHALFLTNSRMHGDGLPIDIFSKIARKISGVDAILGHPDIISIDANVPLLRLEDMQAIAKCIHFQPQFAVKRLIYIPYPSRLNASAANALLKNLEEPNTHTVFVLCDCGTKTVLPTILSRCLKVSLEWDQENEPIDFFTSDDILEINSIFEKLVTAASPYIPMSTWDTMPQNQRLNAIQMQRCVSLAQRLAKAYDASTLQDGLVFLISQTMKPKYNMLVQQILGDIRTWKLEKHFHLSSHNWLTRIFLRAAL